MSPRQQSINGTSSGERARTVGIKVEKGIGAFRKRLPKRKPRLYSKGSPNAFHPDLASGRGSAFVKIWEGDGAARMAISNF